MELHVLDVRSFSVSVQFVLFMRLKKLSKPTGLGACSYVPVAFSRPLADNASVRLGDLCIHVYSQGIAESSLLRRLFCFQVSGCQWVAFSALLCFLRLVHGTVLQLLFQQEGKLRTCTMFYVAHRLRMLTLPTVVHVC